MRKQFPQFLALVVVVSTIVLATSCKKPTGDSVSDNSGVKNRQYVIGMSQCNLGEPWRVQMNADIQAAAAKHPEFKVIFKDAQNDTLKQRSHVEEFVSSKVDLLIISPKEAQPLTEPVARAMDAGIPVIVLDRRLLGDKYTCFIGADNKKIGKAAGEWIVKMLGGKGNVVELMGLQTSTPGQDRHSGFLEGIAGSDIKIIFSADMKWLEPNARQEMESALSRFDTIDLVYAHNDPGAHGAYLAAKAAGREKAMKFVGIDALPQEGVAYVKQGILDATFRYPTGGAEAVDAALKIFNGQTVPKQIVLGTRLFDKSNIDQGGEALP
jgi:ribose transport system substrate-binding protein